MGEETEPSLLFWRRQPVNTCYSHTDTVVYRYTWQYFSFAVIVPMKGPQMNHKIDRPITLDTFKRY